MEIKYSEKSVKQLSKINNGDRKSAENIIRVLEAYSQDIHGNFDLKVLKGKFGDLKRLRIGDYRVIFDFDDINIFIYEIRHRKEVYR